MSQQIIPSSIPTLTIGGRVFTDLSNLIMLVGCSAGANGNSSLRKPGASAGYQVPVGKSFRVLAVRATISLAGAATQTICYSDNDVGFATATAFTNVVYPGGSYDGGTIVFPQAASNTPIEQSMDFTVPAGKYLGCTNNFSASSIRIQVFGYEV